MRLVPFLLVFASCAAGSDLGAPCQMPASVQSGDLAFDYLYLGTTECDDLVCLRRSQSTSSFCSRPCLDASDCGAGWSCLQLVPASVPLEGVTDTRYCTAR